MAPVDGVGDVCERAKGNEAALGGLEMLLRIAHNLAIKDDARHLLIERLVQHGANSLVLACVVLQVAAEHVELEVPRAAGAFEVHLRSLAVELALHHRVLALNLPAHGCVLGRVRLLCCHCAHAGAHFDFPALHALVAVPAARHRHLAQAAGGVHHLGGVLVEGAEDGSFATAQPEVVLEDNLDDPEHFHLAEAVRHLRQQISLMLARLDALAVLALAESGVRVRRVGVNRVARQPVQVLVDFGDAAARAAATTLEDAARNHGQVAGTLPAGGAPVLEAQRLLRVLAQPQPLCQRRGHLGVLYVEHVALLVVPG
mmetsp:Transcript_7425/g.22554  ORF Transcript_7425/g.22554 Transcript_7425/m.22554 type:complete len:314 (-) Transcript_7425:371-1312(-)